MYSLTELLAVRKPNVTPEVQKELAQLFFTIDDLCFKGGLYTFGIKIEFRPRIKSLYGLYSHKSKLITIYNNQEIDRMKFTLAHEMVHGYAHSAGAKHGHDAWFWFTLGQVCSQMGIGINKNIIYSL